MKRPGAVFLVVVCFATGAIVACTLNPQPLPPELSNAPSDDASPPDARNPEPEPPRTSADAAVGDAGTSNHDADARDGGDGGDGGDGSVDHD